MEPHTLEKINKEVQRTTSLQMLGARGTWAYGGHWVEKGMQNLWSDYKLGLPLSPLVHHTFFLDI